MDFRLRESIVSQIRSGKIYSDGLVINPPTMSDVIQAYDVYTQYFNESINQGIMTNSQVEQWMIENNLWSEEKDLKLKKIDKEIEDAKVNLFQNYTIQKERIKNKLRLDVIRKSYNVLSAKKNALYANSCEALAENERICFLLRKTTTRKGKQYKGNIDFAINVYNKNTYSQSLIRDLINKEPWSSVWLMSQKSGVPLFFNAEQEDYTNNQKNILAWSVTYDNISQSPSSPSKEVMLDEDALDGWMIVRSREIEKEKIKQKVEKQTSNNSKIANSDVKIVFNNGDISDEEIEMLNGDQKNLDVQGLFKQKFTQQKILAGAGKQ